MILRSVMCVAILATIACGKSGPPLPPLHLVPEAPSNVVTRRSANDVRFSFVVPAKNANGPGAVNISQVEVYAATVAPGAVVPPNRELISAKNLVGKVEVRQPPREGKPDTAKPADEKPGPGEPATFIEVLDEAKLKPAYTTLPPAAEPAAAVAPAVPATPAPAAVAKRLYVLRGVSRSGRAGQPTTRIELPLADLPPAPIDVKVTFSESAIALAWVAPTPAEGAVQFNVYAADGVAPLNPAPLKEPAFQRTGVEFGKEACFVVRSVVTAGTVAIESDASPVACVTPVDTFAPKAPIGLSSVASTGTISLIWNANAEADLAGYLVLRGEAPGDKLQPLMATPIRETTFRDTTVKPSVRYVYAIVAVDTAGNRSAESPRVEESAR